MQIVVSPELLARIRTLLGSSVPESKSSHRAEALAAGLGFANNAALIAWQKSIAHSEIRVRDLKVAAFNERLATLSGLSAIHLDAAPLASTAALATVTGAPIDEIADTAQEKYFASNPAGDWYAPGMSNRERFAYLAFLLRWRMLMTENVANLVADYSDNADVAGKLAASFQRHSEYDPLMAGFLSDWLLAARAKQDVSWGDAIYTTFRARIRAYMDAVCRTWDEAVDPLTLQASDIRFVPAKDYRPSVSLGTEPVVGISLWDAGMDQFTVAALPGLDLMGMWMSGTSHTAMTKLLTVTRDAVRGMANPELIQGDWTAIGPHAVPAPPYPPTPYPLDEIHPGGFEFWQAATIILADADTAARASELMADAGHHVVKVDAKDPEYERRLDSGCRMTPEMIWIENADPVNFSSLAKLDMFSMMTFVSGIRPSVAKEIKSKLGSALDLRAGPAPRPV